MISIYEYCTYGANARLAICLRCDRLEKRTKMCKECKCLMLLKTRIKGSFCPLGKWGNEINEGEVNKDG
jgi:hypothetical protein